MSRSSSDRAGLNAVAHAQVPFERKVDSIVAVQVLIMPSAERDLRDLGSVAASRVAAKLRTIADEDRIVGDVKRLTGKPLRFRLRVGDYRVLFTIDGDTMKVYRIAHRREAYE